MPKESPGAPNGLLLGQRLEQARVDAGKSIADAAGRLGVSQITIRRYESVQTLPSVAAIESLGVLYGMGEDESRELVELRELARKPGWWRERFGPRTPELENMLRMEGAAKRIRTLDLICLPGLLQTPVYARNVIKAIDLDASPDEIDRNVQLRMARQAKVWDNGAPEGTFVIDEGVLLRMTGGVSLRRAQLARLLALPGSATVRILPFSAGMHPAQGSFAVFDFASERLSRGVFAEAGIAAKASVYIGDEVAEYERVWERAASMALPPKRTASYLHEMMERIDDE